MKAASIFRMRIPSPFLHMCRSFQGMAIAALMLLGFAGPARADLNSITKSIWAMKYGVSNTQINETAPDTGWLSKDDDGDGVTNGDEMAAGTNPFDAGKAIKVTSIVNGGTTVDITFTTEKGKLYTVQGTPTLGSAFGLLSPTVTWLGTGATKTLTLIPKGLNMFFRVKVEDTDSDLDGASDWAENVAGYNPNNAADGGAAVMDGPNGTIASSNVVTVTVTKASAAQPLAGFAPVDTGSITVSRGGPLKFGTLTVPLQISGSALAGIDYDAFSTSIFYDAPSTSALFGVNVGEVVLTVNPKANNSRTTNVTAIVKALAGNKYILGGKTSGSVVINPAGITNGTGLTAKYHHTSSSTYATQQDIFNGVIDTPNGAGTPWEMSRTDPVIDFGTTANTIIGSIALGSPSCVVTTTRDNSLTTGDVVTIAGVTGGTFSPSILGTFPVTVINSTSFSIPVSCTSTTSPTALTVTSGTLTTTNSAIAPNNNANGWGSANGGPRGMSPASASTAFSVRWTGQILPKYSEKYTIDFRSDESAKVRVNGQLLIDRWATQGATDYTNTIDLQAGFLYDIQIDYWNSTGSAEAKLYWYSSSQPKEIIPKSRLFPAPAQASKFTPITSSLAAVGYVGTPFSFNLASPNTSGTTTYALDANSGPLPPGSPALSLNSATGVITGTPSVAGTYNVAINSTNVAAAAVTGSSIVNFTIYPAGGITREILTATGSAVSDIVIPSSTVVPAHDTLLTTFEDDTEYGNNTGERLRGYLVPPKTGNYYFWLAGNNAAELWISTDSEYVNRVRCASLTASSSVTNTKVWNAFTTQQSPWLSLVAGQKYYFEVLHNTGPVGDHHVAVGWCQDDIGTVPSTSTTPNATGALTLLPNGGGTLQGYPLSGTAPRFVFQPYDYPVVTPPTGTLYACNMGPQLNAMTSASGSANLQVNATQTQAILRFNYQGLGTPKTSYHLHNDAFTDSNNVPHVSQIIYDIDDADQNPSEQTGDGGYIWNLAPIGDLTTIPQIQEAIRTGKVYLNIHSVGYPNGEIRGTLGFIDGSQTPPDASLYTGVNAPVATDVASDATGANAARFLNQASFGASPTDVAYVKTNGFQAWITNQLTQPASRTSNDVVAGLSADINTPFPSTLFTDTWWKNSITGPDQLRQRLAFALSEIMVISWANDTGPLQRNGRILADYYDQLVDYCLPTAGLTDSGTFRGILKAVTLTPAMGLYLDMRANQKGDDTLGRHPNENYGREIMQLFSVGIYREWDDGRFVLGSDAGLTATYTQPSIIGVASLLTGWNYAQANQANGRAPTNFGPGADYLNPMVLVPSQHELAKKLLLNNVTSQAASGLTPRVSIAGIAIGTPACTVTTSTIHGLKTGDTITLAGVTAGTFNGVTNATNPAINNSFQATVTSPTAFTVPVICTAASGAVGTVTGATVTPAAISGTAGITAVTGSQADSVGTGANHPYDLYGLTELDRVIDNITNNDNVPPYICRQLIQRLVTSDPSPGYVYRVVQKFKNNGSGVRGDLAAVVSQILLDGEARRSSDTNAPIPPVTGFGKQREPIMRLTGPARAFPAPSYAINPTTLVNTTYSQLTGINANKLRIATSSPNNFSSGFTVNLDFRANYVTPMPSVPNPANNPTSTNYAINTTLGIAATHVAVTLGPGSPTVFTTAQPHGLSTGNLVWFTGLSGKFSDAGINSGGKAVTVDDATTFHLTTPLTTTNVFQVASVSVGNPCIVTTTAPHGMTADTVTTTSGVTINGVNGGFFVGSINGTALSVIGLTPTTFSVTGVSCTSPPTSYTTWREVSNPCLVTTQVPHGLSTGDSVTMASVSGGSFTPTINGTFDVIKVTDSSFTIASSCAVASTPNTGNIVGGNTLDVTATGMVNATYSQLAGSNIMTVNTGGPQTDVSTGTGGSPATIKSKVYLYPLTRNTTAGIASVGVSVPALAPCVVTTTAPHGLTTGDSVTISGVLLGTFSPSINSTYNVTVVDGTSFTVLSNCTVAPTAATGTLTRNDNLVTGTGQGIYDVQTATGTTSFTVDTTPDIPVAARSGNVIVPKISTSYTPSGTNIIYNTNVNHNLVVGNHFWADIPVVGSPVRDAEYAVLTLTDEDHLTTSRDPSPTPPLTTNGTYATNPSGSNNGITIYPLVQPPLGRSGVVKVNQSTFNLGSTEGSLSQSPLNAPTVFNYFLPYYKFPGTLANNGLDSPEFQLTTDTNVMNLTNSMTNMIIGTGGGNSNLNGLSSFNNGSGTVVMDIGSYITTANNAKTAEGGISALIDELANLLVGAPLAANTKTEILNFVNHKTAGVLDYLPYTTPTNLQKRDRVRAIIHLIITSAEFAVQK